MTVTEKAHIMEEGNDIERVGNREMIAKNDEVKRSKIWRIVTVVSTILIIVGVILLLTKLFTTNPLEGDWMRRDSRSWPTRRMDSIQKKRSGRRCRR